MRHGALLLAAAASLALVSCGSEDDDAQQASQDLWGNTYISTAVTENGEPRPLVADTRIAVTFEEREDQGVVRWQSGCNTFGADVEITADRLAAGQIEGTEVGCRDVLREQDDWLMDFFRSNPRLQLNDDRLTLTSGETVVELVDEAPD